MPDFLAAFEKAAKTFRHVVFSASDQLALALDGLCRTPEPTRDYEDLTERFDPDSEPTDQQVRWEARQVAAMATAERLEGSTWSYAHYNAAGDLIGEGSIPSPAVEFPPAAVAGSTPKAVSRPSAKSALTTPAEGHLLTDSELLLSASYWVESAMCYAPLDRRQLSLAHQLVADLRDRAAQFAGFEAQYPEK